MGMSTHAINLITSSDIYRAELAKLNDRADDKVINEIVDVRSKIEELAGTSITELEKMLTAKETAEKLRADICFDILDRAGHAPTERQEVVFSYAEAATEAYQRRRAQITQAKETKSTVVDVTPSEPRLISFPQESPEAPNLPAKLPESEDDINDDDEEMIFDA